MGPAVRSGRIKSVLSAYETTIQKNAESGENCGMYITNKVGKGMSKSGPERAPVRRPGVSKGNGSSHDEPGRSTRPSSNSTRPQQPTQTQQHPRSPTTKPQSEAKKAAEKFKRRSGRVNSGGARRAPQANGQYEDADDEEVDFFQDTKIPTTLSNDSLSQTFPKKNRSENSNFTDTTGELTIEEMDKSAGGGGGRRRRDRSYQQEWNSFDESANYFSEAGESANFTYDNNDDDNDSFSVISESSFQEPNWNPELKKKKAEKKNNHNNWSAGFAVTYQYRPEESDSEFDTEDTQNKIRRKQGSSRDLQRSSSSRSLTLGGNGNSDHYHETEQDMNNSFRSTQSHTLRGKALKQAAMGPGGAGVADSFRNMVLGPSSYLGGGATGIGAGGSMDSETDPSASDSESARSCRRRKKQPSGADLVSESEPDASDSESASRRRRKVKSKTKKPTMNGGLGGGTMSEYETDASDTESVRRRKFQKAKPKQDNHYDPSESDAGGSVSRQRPRKPAAHRKYGAAAEDISNLPPAFQTLARRKLQEQSRPRRPASGSQSSPRRKALPSKPTKTADGDSGDEMDKIMSFNTDLSFFEEPSPSEFKQDRSFFDTL